MAAHYLNTEFIANKTDEHRSMKVRDISIIFATVGNAPVKSWDGKLQGMNSLRRTIHRITLPSDNCADHVAIRIVVIEDVWSFLL